MSGHSGMKMGSGWACDWIDALLDSHCSRSSVRYLCSYLEQELVCVGRDQICRSVYDHLPRCTSPATYEEPENGTNRIQSTSTRMNLCIYVGRQTATFRGPIARRSLVSTRIRFGWNKYIERRRQRTQVKQEKREDEDEEDYPYTKLVYTRTIPVLFREGTRFTTYDIPQTTEVLPIRRVAIHFRATPLHNHGLLHGRTHLPKPYFLFPISSRSPSPSSSVRQERHVCPPDLRTQTPRPQTPRRSLSEVVRGVLGLSGCGW